MLTRAWIVFGFLVLSAGAVARADRYEEVPARRTFDSFPQEIGTWHGVSQALDPATLAVLGVDDYLTRAYFAPDRSGAGLYVGYWASQRQGSTIHSPLNCLPGSGWEPVQTGRIELPDPRGAHRPALTLNRYVVQKGIERQLVVYWYQSQSRIVASEYWSRIYLVLDAVRLGRSDGAIVRITVPIAPDDPNGASAEHVAARFVADLVPQLAPFLPS